MFKLQYTAQANKDAKKLKQAGLKNKAIELLSIIENNPFQNPPPYKKLRGKENRFSRRINIQHRLVLCLLIMDREMKNNCKIISKPVFTKV